MISHIYKDHHHSIAKREAFISEIGKHSYSSFVYLQTCNRVELYEGDGAVSEKIVRHLFRVVSGLESKMLGEYHICGQIRRAYTVAIDENHCSSGLHKLFQHALFTGKRVRTETTLTQNALSHGKSTILLLSKLVSHLEKRNILILGANHLTENITRSLKKHGCNQITILNRTLEKILTFSKEQACTCGELSQLSCKIISADIIISALTLQAPLIHPHHFIHGIPAWIVDLGMPRNISPDVANNPYLRVFNLDHVENAAQQNLLLRTNEIVTAEKIVNEEVYKFMKKPSPSLNFSSLPQYHLFSHN